VDQDGAPRARAQQGGCGGVNFLQQALSYIFTAGNWGGPAGLTARILEHLEYTVVAVFFSALIAIPIGMVIGHTGKGTFLVVTGVNALRALPTLGVLLLGVLLWGLGLVPPTVALMLLGIPPLLAGTYSGIANVDRAVVDAARSMGMTEVRVLLRVEVPNALPLILGGLRTATLQIVATATVAAYASLGGLGRYLIDGIKVREFYLALVGALMVTALALILDGLLASAVWLSVPGTGRLGRGGRMPQPLLSDEVAMESRPRNESAVLSKAHYEAARPSPTVEG
jgi:osmoprotectant transport system permease protein